MRARGAWARGLAFAVLIAALANPLIVHETREPLPDVVALIVDHSQSMDVPRPQDAADKAAAAIKAQLEDQTRPRTCARARATHATPARTTARSCSRRSTTRWPTCRRSAWPGAIVITDGEVHDAPAPGKLTLKAPLQVLIAGKHDEKRPQAHRGQRRALRHCRPDARDRAGGGRFRQRRRIGYAEVDVRVDGKDRARSSCRSGKKTTINVPITHGGENVVELIAKPGPAELTLAEQPRRGAPSAACATGCACCWFPASRMPASGCGASC